MAKRRVQNFLVRHGNITPISTRGIVTNPAETLEFMGQVSDRVDISPAGMARLFSISIWAARCIRVRARKVASLPLTFGYRKTKPPTEPTPDMIAGNIALQTLFKRSLARLMRHTEYDLCVFGQAFWVRGKDGLKRLNPSTIVVDKGPQGIKGFQQKIEGKVVARWKPDELIYFYDYDPHNDLNGLAPLHWAVSQITTDAHIAAYVYNFFENDATPAGILTTEQALLESDLMRTYTWWQKLFRGSRNKGKVGVLDKGLTYTQIQASMNDLAIKDLRYEDRREICGAMDVPMTIALADESANFAVSEQEYSAFYTETIIPEMDFILETMNEQLAAPVHEGLLIEADYSKVEVLQIGKAAITTRAVQGFQAGVRSLNEARELEGLPSLQNDFIFIPGVGLTPVDQLENARVPAPQAMLPGGFPLPGNTSSPSNNGGAAPAPNAASSPDQGGGNGTGGGPPAAPPGGAAPRSLALDVTPIQRTVDDALAQTAQADIRRWAGKVKKKGAQTPFESRYIPKAIASFLRWDLQTADDDGDIAEAFAEAEAWLRSTDPTPAEFEFYWRDFDDVATEFVNLFAGWVAGLPIIDRVTERIDKTTTRTADGVSLTDLITKEETDALIAQMVGTKENPGPQTKIYLAGAARGQEVLDYLKANRKAAGQISVAWDLVNDHALQYAQDYDYELVRGINDTTASAFQDVIGAWVTGGGNFDNLVQAVRGELGGLDIPAGWSRQKIEWATSLQRARLIAQTESTRVFAHGNYDQWHQGGVGNVRIRTQNDRPVCSTCRGVNNLETALPIGGAPPVWIWKGKAYRIPLHPGCRCFPQPVVMALDHPMVGQPMPLAPKPAAQAPAPIMLPSKPKVPAPGKLPPLPSNPFKKQQVKPGRPRPAPPVLPAAKKLPSATEAAFQKAIDPNATRSARELPTLAETRTAPTKRISNMNINATYLTVVDGRVYFKKEDLEILGAKAEQTYSKFADIVGIGDKTPAVQVLEEGPHGSSLVMEYLGDYESMNLALNTYDGTSWAKDHLDNAAMEKLMLSEYISGQKDRHSGNIMIKPDGSFMLIDNTSTFGSDVRGGANSRYLDGWNFWEAPRFLDSTSLVDGRAGFTLTLSGLESMLATQKSVYKMLKAEMGKDTLLGAQARYGALEALYSDMKAKGKDSINYIDAMNFVRKSKK